CYTPARACSDTHSTDRNRTGGESNFPFTRLYSGSYAWPLLCTEIQFLKQNRAPHVVEAWACVNFKAEISNQTPEVRRGKNTMIGRLAVEAFLKSVILAFII